MFLFCSIPPVKPISDLKAHAAELIRALNEGAEPLIVTVRGAAKAVSAISPRNATRWAGARGASLTSRPTGSSLASRPRS